MLCKVLVNGVKEFKHDDKLKFSSLYLNTFVLYEKPKNMKKWVFIEIQSEDNFGFL